jgi:hypothetical protein
MKRLSVLLTVLTLLIAVSPGAMAAKKGKAQLGVFGTINGKKLKATSRDGVTDACVNGIYKPADGIIVFTAFECKPKRRRQGAVKKDFKGLVMSCSAFAAPGTVLTPPFDIPCAGSVYEQNKTGRFGLPVSTSRWSSNFDFTDPFSPTSNLRMRVDGFDGTNVRGVIYGVFEVPQSGPLSTVPASITGELTFDFPFRVQ